MNIHEHAAELRYMALAAETPSVRQYTALVQGILEDSASDREQLLRLCHNAPKAVGVDTRDLATAILRLVDFAWESVA